MKYLIARDGQQIGEWTLDELRSMRAMGQARDTDYAWRPGMAEWIPLGQAFAAEGGAAAPPPPQSWHPARPTVLGGFPPPPPSSNLIWAILVTIFCCLPLGIPAIIFAAQVDSKYAMGDYAGAQASAAKAKTWILVSLIVGLLGGALYGLFVGLAAASGM
jgi:hypothetical protein